MDNETFEKVVNRDHICVHIVNPAIDNPSRSTSDYEQEQKEARERHAMLQKEHKSIIRSTWAAVFAAVFACITALATCGLVYYTYLELPSKQIKIQTSQLQELQAQQPPIQNPSHKN